MNYFVYIVRCSDNTLYTGSTNDMTKRLKQHNGLLKGGAKYTRGRRPVVLVYSQPCQSKTEALQQEATIKRLGRKKKLDLCFRKKVL